jgi:simple sugar transport system ATP-binding protein
MLSLRNISKSFGRNRALHDATVEFRRGEIIGLVGENGAGKTTLMRIVAGELTADSGTLEVDGRVLSLRSPGEAAAHGIAIVHQHFQLVPALTIAENLALQESRGFAFTSRRRIEAAATETIAASGIALHGVGRRVSELAVGEKAKLELVKALARQPRFLILDEPTSVLTPSETGELFHAIRDIAARGVTVVFISHKLPEITSIAERIVVMRRGAIVASNRTSAMTPDEIVHAMVGDAHSSPQHDAASSRNRGELVLQCIGISTEPGDRSVALNGISLDMHAGEIVAILGVAGNGQSELAAVLRGIARRTAGEILVRGEQMNARELFASRELAHIPEDRTRDGIIGEMSVAENLALRDERWSARAANQRAASLITRYSIRSDSPAQEAGALSGGNQQKVILARELEREPRAVIAAEPTRGLDLASTAFVHARLRETAGRRSGVLLITSDLDEAFALADTVHVMYRGRLSSALPVDDARGRVSSLMAGVE